MSKSRTTNNRLQGNSKQKSGSPKRKTQNSPSAASYSALKERFDAQAGGLREARGQQGGKTENLSVIATSPTDLQPVLDAVAENAARLCDSNDAQLRLIDGNILCLVASYVSLPTPEIKPLPRQNVIGRAVIDRQMIH